MHRKKIAVLWLRRDLRLHDHAALHHALKSGLAVLPLFIFDKDILDRLEDKHDRRVLFIYQSLLHLNTQLRAQHSQILIKIGTPLQVWKGLFQDYDIEQVYYNHDYEPAALSRDQKVEELCKQHYCKVFSYKDQCIFDKDEILKEDGKPYTVFTPYSKKWHSKLNAYALQPYAIKPYLGNLLAFEALIPNLGEIGFEDSPTSFPEHTVTDDLLAHYHATRDLPAIKGTSRLSVHLRFGTISIRMLAARAQQLSNVYLNELVWRDFYMMILHHFPQVVVHSFKAQYDRIAWNNDEQQFQRWCQGETGYPMVDAGMRELNATGFMHNRVRMITASFLCKHLLIDWRWGEAYFAQKLLDYDLAANNGGWQWAAGTGCDAAPYFRVFNPSLQMAKYDPKLEYVRKWVPEYGTASYNAPMVVHEFARQRALDVYKKDSTVVNGTKNTIIFVVWIQSHVMRIPLLLIVLAALFFSFTHDDFSHPFDQVVRTQKSKVTRKRLEAFRKGGIELPLVFRQKPDSNTYDSVKVDVEKIIGTAKKYLGTRHRMGGISKKGIDCSGMVMMSLRSCAIHTPHNSHEQARYGKIISDMDSLQRGDLVFYINSFKCPYLITHSGICLGDGKFIHASANSGVVINDLKMAYWKAKFIFGTRIKD